MSEALIPLHSPVLLGIFREALEASLIERGAVLGLELLGPVDAFWHGLPLAELSRMARAGNAQAQAELAWRYASAELIDTAYTQALRWAKASAEQHCGAGQAVLGWLIYHGFGQSLDYAAAARLFEQAAASGDLRGLTWLGLCLLRGHGLETDVERALRLLHQAGRMRGKGAALAQYCLGRIYYFGLLQTVQRDFVEAARYLHLAAAQEHQCARELLARCFFFGRGIAENRVEAVRLWREAAAGDSAAAMYCLGMCLYAGEGIAQDMSEAVRWFRAAARKQIDGAMLLLGQCYTFGYGVDYDPQIGLDWYRQAAELGNRDAAFELGEWYAFGRGGLEQNISLALHHYRSAARQGHPRAQLKLGHCYRSGDGVAENKSLAISWYRRAADGQDIAAQICLGECYELGEGVEVDAQRALEYYQLAADKNDPHGLAELGRCYLRGIGGVCDMERGEFYLRAAVEGGWPLALGELERCLFAKAEELFQASLESHDADLLAQFAAQALVYYRKAGELGHKRAAFKLGECYRAGYGTPQDEEKAMLWFRKAARLFEAKIALADLYYFGFKVQGRPTEQGMQPNYREALRWYEQAVEQHEDAYAMYSLGFCLLHGQGAKRSAHNYREGVRWLRKAAMLGEVDAQYELGCAYYQGTGVARNSRLAMKWLRSAARLGHVEAQGFLAQLAAVDV